MSGSCSQTAGSKADIGRQLRGAARASASRRGPITAFQVSRAVRTGQYSGSSSAGGTINNFGNVSTASLNGTSSGTMTATSTPIYHYKRQTSFTARLLEPATGRNLWVGNGEVNAKGLLFVGNGASASSSVGAIFDDLQQKGIIGRSS
jgi:hypothetical protein